MVTLKKNSIDYYAAIRSLYRQKRELEISNGSEADIPAIPDFEFGDFPEFDDPEPSLGETGDENIDTDDGGEISALPEAAAGSDAGSDASSEDSVGLSLLDLRFDPEIHQLSQATDSR